MPYEEADLYVLAFADMDFGPEDDESDDEYPAFLSMGPKDDEEEEPKFEHYAKPDEDGNIVHRIVDPESGEEFVVAVEWLVEFNGEPFYVTS